MDFPEIVANNYRLSLFDMPPDSNSVDYFWRNLVRFGDQEYKPYTDSEILAFHDVMVKDAQKYGLFDRLRKKELPQKERKGKGDYLWITINPKPEVKLLDFVSRCHEAFKLAVIDSGSYVFEQRGTKPGDYPGFHCHGLFKRGRRRPEVEREMKRKFKDMVGNDLHIQMKWVQATEITKISLYLQGVKDDKSKDDKCRNDKPFRKDNNLKEIYSAGEKNLLEPAPVRPILDLKKKLILKKP